MRATKTVALWHWLTHKELVRFEFEHEDIRDESGSARVANLAPLAHHLGLWIRCPIPVSKQNSPVASGRSGVFHCSVLAEPAAIRSTSETEHAQVQHISGL